VCHVWLNASGDRDTVHLLVHSPFQDPRYQRRPHACTRKMLVTLAWAKASLVCIILQLLFRRWNGQTSMDKFLALTEKIYSTERQWVLQRKSDSQTRGNTSPDTDPMRSLKRICNETPKDCEGCHSVGQIPNTATLTPLRPRSKAN
jgi:hypothetical protein